VLYVNSLSRLPDFHWWGIVDSVAGLYASIDNNLDGVNTGVTSGRPQVSAAPFCIRSVRYREIWALDSRGSIILKGGVIILWRILVLSSHVPARRSFCYRTRGRPRSVMFTTRPQWTVWDLLPCCQSVRREPANNRVATAKATSCCSGSSFVS
jgi:hypothetical protein